MKILLSLLLLLLLLFFRGLISAQQDQSIDWKYEIDLLGKELAQKHINLFFQTDSVEFFNALDRIAEQARGKSIFHVSVQLQQVLATMGDAHTRMNYHFNVDGDAILPLECYWFEEGIYILKTRREYQDILGKKLTAINGYPMDRVIDSLSTLIVNENPFLIKAELPKMIPWIQLLEHFGFADRNGLELELEDTRGQVLKHRIDLPPKEGEAMSAKSDGLPLGWQDRKSFFRDRFFPDEKIYYIQYNKCWSREAEEEFGSGASALFMPSFREFEKKVFHSIWKQDIDILVFDMRFNMGGNSQQGTKFIKKLSKTKLNGTGKIYLLIGRQTFSSAILNTMDFVKLTDVVLVGEGTGGRPNHYGEVNRFVLPESNLVVSYSTKYFKVLEEDPPSIIPEIEASPSFKDFMNGTDRAMEAIRDHHPH